MAAGSKTLEILGRPGFYERLEALSAKLKAGLKVGATKSGIDLTVNRAGSMFTPFFTSVPVTDYASAKKSDTAAFGRFFHAMLNHGVYLPPSQFEAAFVSASHSEADVQQTIDAAGLAFAEAREKR
jgi:glutamate-1-semialdehyde 2,1-aminomutase